MTDSRGAKGYARAVVAGASEGVMVGVSVMGGSVGATMGDVERARTGGSGEFVAVTTCTTITVLTMAVGVKVAGALVGRSEAVCVGRTARVGRVMICVSCGVEVSTKAAATSTTPMMPMRTR